MNEKKPNVFFIIAPLIVTNLVANIISIPMAQIWLGLLMLNNSDELSYRQLLDLLIEESQSGKYMMMLNILTGLACGVIFFLWYKRIKKNQKGDSIPIGKTRPVFLIFSMLMIGIGMQFIGHYMIRIMSMAFPKLLLDYQYLLSKMGAYDTHNSLYYLFTAYTFFIAPITEELAYRGISMHYARNRFSAKISIFVTALLFACIHTTLFQMSYTFVFAIVLGYVVIRTGKIWITIGIHMIFNMSAFLVEQLSFFGRTPALDFVAMLFSMMAIYFGVIILLKSVPLKED